MTTAAPQASAIPEGIASADHPINTFLTAMLTNDEVGQRTLPELLDYLLISANAHMARDPNAALLAEIGGTAYLADKDDEGIVTHNFRQSPHSLECCCCGGGLVGRQWHNRDTGYGLCLGCIDYCMRGETVETFERNYGLRGVHYDLTPFT